jgi:hypothetical protein
MTKHTLPLQALYQPNSYLTFPLPSPSTPQISQRCRPHHHETEAAHAHPRANQNHHQDSAGKTKAHAQTTPSPATLTTATATMLLLLAGRPPLTTAIVTAAIDHPDVMEIETAIALDHLDETTAIATGMEGREDAHPDVTEEAETTERKEKRMTNPKTKKRRRNPSLLLRPVVQSP